MSKLTLLLRYFFLLMIICFSYVTYQILTGPVYAGPFNLFRYLSLGVLTLFTFSALMLEKSAYAGKKFMQRFFVTMVGLPVLAFATFTLIQQSQIDSRRTILHLKSLPDAQADYEFQFKSGGHFVFVTHEKLGPERYYGRFESAADTFRILSSNYKSDTFPVLGLFRLDTMRWKGFEKMVVAH